MRFWRFHLGSFILKLFTGSILLSIISCWILWYHVSVDNHPVRRSAVSFTTAKCNNLPRIDTSSPKDDIKLKLFFKNFSTTRNQRKVLIVYKHTSLVFRINIVTVLESNRIPYHLVFNTDRTILPVLEDESIGKFAVIVFESLKFYTGLSSHSRKILDQYSRDHSVGLVLFTGEENYSYLSYYSKILKIRLQTGVKDLKNVELNPRSQLLRLTRAGGLVEGDLPSQWTVFSSNHSTHEYVEIATQETTTNSNINDLDSDPESSITHVSTRFITVMLDRGKLDGIKRVYFGSGVTFWLHRLLFIDSLSFLSERSIEKPLHRWILVDVDDIFVGKVGIRMIKEDVQALISVQKRINSRVPGFKFNLGFSGFHYLRGNEEEDDGDRELIKNADKFWWFSHMWTHRKAHQIKTPQELKDELMLNLDFAKKHNIPVNTSYAVAPHHSGVYPVHDLLYDSWKVHYNLKVTSTEEYPHLTPAYRRRGFIYKGIKVLPRQTCGLYTKTIFLNKYPRGQKRLENSIYGGELFQQVVDNPINIFMTHLSNYGNDRLALHTFENVVKYLQCWTNLKLRTEHPLVLADMYFKLFHEEKDPLWGNPCNDKRHLSIWETGKSCHRLPSVVIIGPQKTGTTALYQYLSMHPEVISNEKSVKTYEEVQFFNGLNYLKGLDWYLGFFKDVGNTSTRLLFEKSANYFDSPLAPLRVATLLPRAKIITILIDPVKRAYSWYQHVKSHGMEAAVKHTFYDVVTKSNTSDNREFHVLGQRCLMPGHYAQHLEHWLKYYNPSQIEVIDGNALKKTPADVMLDVQQFIGVTIYDYNSKLRFDKRKGFYCLVTAKGSHKCLGKSKGRHYPPIDQNSRDFLERYYKESNQQLASLLLRIEKPLPSWLSEKTK